MTTTIGPDGPGPWADPGPGDGGSPTSATYPPMLPPATRSEQVVAALAVPGVDLVAARSVVEERYRHRRTARWMRVGAVAGCVVVLGLVALLFGRSDDRVDTVASAGSTTTTTAAPSSSTTTAPIAPPASVAPPSTVPASAAIAPSTSAAPAVNQPLTARLSTVGDATVGGALTLRIDWNDADHAVNGDPEISVEWGDPVVAAPPSSGDGGVCAAVGSPRAGTAERTFRYATAGSWTISVRLRSCGASGPFGEDVTVSTQVEVQPSSAPTVVASVGAGLPDPDLASAVRYPADGGSGGALALRTPPVGSVLVADPARRATVLSSSSWGAGDVVVLAWSDGSCAWGTVGADGASGGLVLDRPGCQPVLPVPSTTTVPSTTAPGPAAAFAGRP